MLVESQNHNCTSETHINLFSCASFGFKSRYSLRSICLLIVHLWLCAFTLCSNEGFCSAAKQVCWFTLLWGSSLLYYDNGPLSFAANLTEEQKKKGRYTLLSFQRECICLWKSLVLLWISLFCQSLAHSVVELQMFLGIFGGLKSYCANITQKDHLYTSALPKGQALGQTQQHKCSEPYSLFTEGEWLILCKYSCQMCVQRRQTDERIPLNPSVQQKEGQDWEEMPDRWI